MICRAIPYEGKEPYIFISYCHKDKSQVYPILEQMARDSYQIWYDDGNHAGDEWTDNIENHLEACKAVVAFISNDSSVSHNCKSEITYALKCEKKIVPVLIDNADLPKGMRMQLSYLHYLKKADFPSDQALLRKVYELEECKACKAVSGSLLLRPEPAAVECKNEEKLAVKKEEKVGEASGEHKHGGITKVLRKHKELKTAKPNRNDKRGSKPILVEPKPAPVNSKTDPVEPKPTLPEKEDMPASGGKLMDNNGTVTQKDYDESDYTARDMDWDNNDATIYDDEKTVYQEDSEDDDVTVRKDFKSIMPALLLHPAMGKAYILSMPQAKLGRSSAMCDVVIGGDNSISKHHADIIQYNQKCFLRDENSSNGTYINGKQLNAGEQILLENPAVFQLSDTTLILSSGQPAKDSIREGCVACLINKEGTGACFIGAEPVLLNRKHVWPDGTLSDRTIHREAHARLVRKQGGICLINESANNATRVNEEELKPGESRMLSSGDVIRLGERTNLQFVLIEI